MSILENDVASLKLFSSNIENFFFYILSYIVLFLMSEMKMLKKKINFFAQTAAQIIGI